MIVKHLMNENFRRRYLLPFERIKLKGTYEDKPHGFKQDEKKDEKSDEKSDETSDEKIDEKNDESQEDKQDTTIENEPDISERTNHELENGGIDKEIFGKETEIPQDRTEDGAKSDPEGDVIAQDLSQEAVAENDTNYKKDTPDSQKDEAKDKSEGDADSDVASEIDSDAVFEDAVHSYDINAEDNRARLYRYEVNYCAYHLRRVEELFEPSDRVGSEWEEFEALRIAFFRNESPYFRSWVNLINQVRNGILSWVDDIQTIHPTHVTASYGLTSLMQKLVADGADLAQLTDEGYTPLDYAIEYYNGVKADDKQWYRNSTSLFKTILEGKADVNAVPSRANVAPFYRLFW